LRKFQVKVDLQKHSKHNLPKRAVRGTERNSKEADVFPLKRDFELLANDSDDAKVRVKQLLTQEGYDEKLLHHAIWTVTRKDRPKKS
jgi:hypothetical protein